jgi:uncharacterized membrane protein YbhN (UPF0104 family)
MGADGYGDERRLRAAGRCPVESCLSFVVIFRRFFATVPARPARELAWTEMGSGALLPGGGIGSLAVGGWLLHLAGMPTRQILRRSSGLFFLTSAVNVTALIGGGVLLATGLSPLAVLVLGYIVGYLANLIPIPGAVGVLEGGLAGTLILYGAPDAQAAAGVLVYHAIAFWIPNVGGLLAYRQLRRQLPDSR